MTRDPESGYFASRWHAEVEIRVLLWRDVLIVGTLINFVAGFAAMIMLIQDVSPLWGLGVYLAPVPYNIFLLLCVWRSKQCTPLVSLIATAWFVLVLIV